MLDAIRSFFNTAMNPPEEAAPAVRERDIRLAACALLLELAHADDEFTEEERTHLTNAVRRQYGLDAEQAEQLLRMAERQRAQAVDLWQFTSLIKENYSLGQKMVLAEIMWGLVYADGELARREDWLMRKISHLLDLKAGYLTAARRRVEGGESDVAEVPPID